MLTRRKRIAFWCPMMLVRCVGVSVDYGSRALATIYNERLRVLDPGGTFGSLNAPRRSLGFMESDFYTFLHIRMLGCDGTRGSTHYKSYNHTSVSLGKARVLARAP